MGRRCFEIWIAELDSTEISDEHLSLGLGKYGWNIFFVAVVFLVAREGSDICEIVEVLFLHQSLFSQATSE